MPLEDLGVLVLDSERLTLTSGALVGAARHGAVVLVGGAIICRRVSSCRSRQTPPWRNVCAPR